MKKMPLDGIHSPCRLLIDIAASGRDSRHMTELKMNPHSVHINCILRMPCILFLFQLPYTPPAHFGRDKRTDTPKRISAVTQTEINACQYYYTNKNILSSIETINLARN